ncbi:hypothetical protein [Pelomicrobium methylotrophicum]|uniref:Uncharacterized protein n=1 Tax=Pelomicrobium methylotrophicum TaxID=2602750 RepID=A0A5C7ETB2_9PROT|nr:hypothetical protein [Pelomicrobium methylotrophicum]TXF11149.1 hypothetical protein FR698_11580 [Pelomicrobium methylotrophicum]
MANVRFVTNGNENGKTAYLVKQGLAGMWITIASIVFDGERWCVHKHGRIDRFEKLREAKDEAIKSAC